MKNQGSQFSEGDVQVVESGVGGFNVSTILAGTDLFQSLFGGEVSVEVGCQISPSYGDGY